MTIYSDHFEKKQTHSVYWFNKSSDLHTAASALWQSRAESHSQTESDLREITPVYYMLCGLSLELMYKAIIVAKGGEFKLNHKLIPLAERAGIDLDKTLRGLFELLTESVEWDGKYPVPGSYQKLEQLENLYYKYLHDTVSFGRIKAYKPNNALNWQAFDNLWQEGSRMYWKYHRPAITKAK